MTASPDNLLTPGLFADPDPSNPQAANIAGAQALVRGATNLLWRGARGVAGDVWENLIKPPGQILLGERTPYAGYANSLDPAAYVGRLAGYGMGVGSVLAPAMDAGAGMFAGSLARTAKHLPVGDDLNLPIGGSRTLGDAMFLQMRGADRDEIFDKTGWFQGADSKWRFNISDEGANLKVGNLDRLNSGGDPDKDWFGPKRLPFKFVSTGGLDRDTQKVGDLLDHPELFKAYPDLADIPVHAQSIGDIGYSLGGYNSRDNVMTLAKQPLEGLKSTMLHELQHAVQAREDFARGGNPAEFLHPTHDKDINYILRTKDAQEKELKAWGVQPGDIQRYYGFGYYDSPYKTGFKPEQLEAIKNVPQALVDDYKENWDLHKLFQQDEMEAHKSYLGLAGEVEARATQSQSERGVWNEPIWRVPDYRGRDWSGKPVFEQPYTFEEQTVWPQSRLITPGGGLP